MSKSWKIIVFAVGGFVGFLILVALALLLFVDVNVYKPRLETAASETMGMEIHVGGQLGIGIFPGFHVTLKDVHIRNRGADIASAPEVRLRIRLLPLLHQQVRIEEIALRRPRISIERDRDGRFNFEKPEEPKRVLPVLALARVSLADGTLLFVDQQSGVKIEAENCNLGAKRIRFMGGESPDLLKNLSFTAEFACGAIRGKDVALSDFKFSVDGKDGVFDLKPVTLRIFGGQGSGNIRVDLSGAVPLYHVQCFLSQFRIEEFLKTLSPKKVAEGSMDFSANLSMQGKSALEIKRTADGEISLRGDNLVLEGHDLDRVLSRYESSQKFSPKDVGALLYAGPFGLAATKGYDFARIFKGSGGNSRIRTLVAHWQVENGMAQMRDVAMTTDENRLALKGELDFINARFDDVTVAAIDAQGCAKVRQKIRGPFGKPEVEKPDVLVSLAGPALNLLKQARKILPGGQCEVFYAGSVAPPK